MNSKAFRRFKLKTARYRELQYICWQYTDMIEEMDALTTTSPNMDGQPRGSETSDPTHDAAVRRERLATRVYAIQRCARVAGGPNAGGLLMGVTTRGSNFEMLQMKGVVFCGRRQYYEMRRHFFWLLSQIL